MTAIYQKNFKKVKEAVLDKNFQLGTVDPFAYPYSDIQLPHDHTRFSIGPWDNYYSSPVFNINLYQIVDAGQLKNQNFVLVRDGLFTLVDFFHRFPDPKIFKKIFIVHENLKNFIPQKWSNYILFYNFEVFKDYYSGKKFTDTLIVKGVVMEGTVDYDQFFSLIEKARKQKKINRILLCVLPRQNWFTETNWNGDGIYNEIASNFLKRIHQDLGPQIKVEFIAWKDFFALPDLHTYEFLDFNKKLKVYADDYTDFFLYKRAAKPLFLKQRKSKNPEDVIASLTFTHGVRLLASPEDSTENCFEELCEIFNALGVKKGNKLNASCFQAISKFANKFPEKFEDKYLC